MIAHLSYILSRVAEMIVGFPGFEISLALKAALQITAVNFFLYLAVLPIIALTCRRAGSFLKHTAS
jgi:ABC-2 type transport system permease protein